MVSLRIVIPLTSAAAMMFACGPWSRASQQERGARHTAVSAATPVATSLDVRVDEEVEIVLAVTNSSSKSLELRFPDGQTHEFSVRDERGREVWRWSEGRMFTSMARATLMQAGEAIAFDATWDPENARGKYVAVATLRSSNHRQMTQVEFTLP